MKHEWRKKEKGIYIPKNKPEFINIPEFRFLTINGTGNPNDKSFQDYITVLYSLSYAIKMSPKKGITPNGYFDYTVYPLEGVWDINEEAKKTFDGSINKDDLVFKLMIRQPNFVDNVFVEQIIHHTKDKKPHPLLDRVVFETISEGNCVQMMHIGSYDSEPASFKIMEEFTENNSFKRTYKKHREIYLSDFRKVAPEKLKTVLRFNVTPK
ncbi:GyrI-like domain-containing protein [Aquimarina sp. 2201CG5-10]|uniref:GyrI-like domain-containing protein n=1 Tax=Aquimarina callyspongiae TaxID=3098150 RepID=UPI002AB495B0|nr:GyrI-like domain-containing protein [Aquimarina sp. 2201CG5-10]MDY8135510.1 GyrI-like domain-containing protein [Aquimarina sp. 2201CG5-10]